MQRQEIITQIIKMIRRSTYTARACEELESLGFEGTVMKHHTDTEFGKAMGGLEILNYITGSSYDNIYDQAYNEATQDIITAKGSIVELLDLAGFDGERYYNNSINH